MMKRHIGRTGLLTLSDKESPLTHKNGKTRSKGKISEKICFSPPGENQEKKKKKKVANVVPQEH